MDITKQFLETYTKSIEQDADIRFIITKSDNKNVVAYKIDNNRELSVFWQTWEELINDKPAIYNLSMLEKSLAFGFSGPELKENKLHITLNGYPSLPIYMNTEDDQNTFITFSNVNYRLLGIHAHMEQGFMKNKKPKGISLIVQLPLDDNEFSPTLSIYIAHTVQV